MNWWYGNKTTWGFILISASACSSHTATEGAQAPLTASSTPTASTSAPNNTGAPPALLDAGATPVGSVAPFPQANGAAPEAGKMCGGIAGFRCPDKQYCAFPIEAQCGAADMAGVCKPIPDMCTMEYAPVCGCDGKTYGSTCVAARGGISIVKKGACEGEAGGVSIGIIPDGKPCGTRGVPGTCGTGSYCAFKDPCGSTDAGGICTKRPQICNHLMAPVCGCDGKTYPNNCYATREGMNVASTGACKTP